MTIDVRCACGARFAAPPALAGGHANCPRCGKAAPVPGLRDPFWRLLQVGAVLTWVAVTSLAWSHGGPGVGLAVGACLAALLWLCSRAL